MPSLPHALCTVLCTVHRTVLWSSPPDNHPDQSGCSDEYNDVRVNRLSLAALRVLGKPLPTVLKDRIMDPIGASPSWSWNGYSTSFVDLNGERVQSVSGGGHWVRVAASLRARVCVCVCLRESERARERERERERERKKESLSGLDRACCRPHHCKAYAMLSRPQGGGLFISSRDHARFGLLHLRDGVWGEKRLIPEGWMDLALEPSPTNHQ